MDHRYSSDCSIHTLIVIFLIMWVYFYVWYFTFWVLFKVLILFSNTGTTYWDLNSNETTFFDINSTSLLEVSTSLPETSTSLKEAITRSEGTAISAESDGIVTEATNFNSNDTTPPLLSPITELGNRSEYFRHLWFSQLQSKIRLLLVHEYQPKIKGYWCLAPEKGTNLS